MTWMIRRAAAVALCLVAAAACGGGGGGDGDDVAASTTAAPAGSGSGSGSGDVTIVDFNFDPEPLEVEAGATVVWTNDDDATHSIEDGGDLGYESDDLAQGDTFEQTFDEPGEYPYICGVHSYMKGTVVVS